MKPRMCRTGGEGVVGDCLRACVASILEVEPETVPHFFEDGCDSATGMQRLRNYLRPLGYAPFISVFDNSASIDDILVMQRLNNPGMHYLLFGRTESGGDHVVIGYDGEIVHNPAWAKSPMISAQGSGFWFVMCLARI